MDRELLAYFRRARREQPAGADGHRPISPVMTRIVDRLPDHPAMVFSAVGEVLRQTRPAVALFGDYTGAGGLSRDLVDRWFTDPAARGRYLVEVGTTGHRRLRRYRHVEWGRLELYRQVLIDPVDRRLLLLLTAVPDSPSDTKLRLLAAVGE